MGSQFAAASKKAPDALPSHEKLAGLLAVFQRVCESLDLETGDDLLAQTVARAVIEAGLAGEEDPDRLFEHAMQAALTS